jgi:hypothetical protein
MSLTQSVEPLKNYKQGIDKRCLIGPAWPQNHRNQLGCQFESI